MLIKGMRKEEKIEAHENKINVTTTTASML
jgi:hypothetical protein